MGTRMVLVVESLVYDNWKNVIVVAVEIDMVFFNWFLKFGLWVLCTERIICLEYDDYVLMSEFGTVFDLKV